MSRKDPQLNLRLPAELKDMLESAAETNNRSVTAETVERLRASFTSNDDSENTLFLLSRLELRAAEAEMEILRYYTVAFHLYQQVKLLSEELPEVEKMEPSERAKTIASMGPLQKVLQVAQTGLRLDEGVIPMAELAEKMSDEIGKLKSRSERLFEDIVRKQDKK